MFASRRHFLSLLVAGAALWPVPVAYADSKKGKKRGSDDDDDREEASRARAAGKILSLQTIISRAGSAIDGEIVEVEFEYDDGVPVYEIYYIDPKGRRREIKLDARNAAIREHD